MTPLLISLRDRRAEVKEALMKLEKEIEEEMELIQAECDHPENEIVWTGNGHNRDYYQCRLCFKDLQRG